MVKGFLLIVMIMVFDIFNNVKIVGGIYFDYMIVYILVVFIYWVICMFYVII